MRTSDFPKHCDLCGEDFPDLEAIFTHPCEGIERLRKLHRPTLGCYRTVMRYYRRLPPNHWRRRLIDWGLRQQGEDVEFLDALRKIGPRKVGRIERKLLNGGLVEPVLSRRSGNAWLRQELDEMEEELA